MKITPLKAACLVFAFLFVYGQVGKADFEDSVKQDLDYCKNVETWQQASHLPPTKRPGHPNYKPEIDCSAKGGQQ